MALLREYVSSPPRSHQPLLLIQSSIAQSGIPLLRQIIIESSKQQSCTCLTFCLLYRPSDLIEENVLSDHIKVYDWLEFVPGYTGTFSDTKRQMLQAVKEAPASGILNVVIDSVDTLLQSDGTLTEVYKLLRALLGLLKDRLHPSRLVLHVYQSTKLLSLLTQISLSPSLVYLTVHPPALLVHLAKEYMAPPPPSSPEAKFWSIFLPVRDRPYESISLVYGPRGEGSGHPKEMVVEILVRGSNEAAGRRSMPRALEGWSILRGEPCELTSLESLRAVWRKVVEEVTPDPTQNISFNLQLTPDQQESRAQVPLPYAIDGMSMQRSTASAILYDPDSADDIDDDDPDEDLDI